MSGDSDEILRIQKYVVYLVGRLTNGGDSDDDGKTMTSLMEVMASKDGPSIEVVDRVQIMSIFANVITEGNGGDEASKYSFLMPFMVDTFYDAYMRVSEACFLSCLKSALLIVSTYPNFFGKLLFELLFSCAKNRFQLDVELNLVAAEILLEYNFFEELLEIMVLLIHNNETQIGLRFFDLMLAKGLTEHKVKKFVSHMIPIFLEDPNWETRRFGVVSFSGLWAFESLKADLVKIFPLLVNLFSDTNPKVACEAIYSVGKIYRQLDGLLCNSVDLVLASLVSVFENETIKSQANYNMQCFAIQTFNIATTNLPLHIINKYMDALSKFFSHFIANHEGELKQAVFSCYMDLLNVASIISEERYDGLIVTVSAAVTQGELLWLFMLAGFAPSRYLVREHKLAKGAYSIWGTLPIDED